MHDTSWILVHSTIPKVFSVPLRLSTAIKAGVHWRERGEQRSLRKTVTHVPARAHARCRAEKEGGPSLHYLQVKFKYLRAVKIKIQSKKGRYSVCLGVRRAGAVFDFERPVAVRGNDICASKW